MDTGGSAPGRRLAVGTCCHGRFDGSLSRAEPRLSGRTEAARRLSIGAPRLHDDDSRRALAERQARRAAWRACSPTPSRSPRPLAPPSTGPAFPGGSAELDIDDGAVREAALRRASFDPAPSDTMTRVSASSRGATRSTRRGPDGGRSTRLSGARDLGEAAQGGARRARGPLHRGRKGRQLHPQATEVRLGGLLLHALGVARETPGLREWPTDGSGLAVNQPKGDARVSRPTPFFPPLGACPRNRGWCAVARERRPRPRIPPSPG